MMMMESSAWRHGGFASSDEDARKKFFLPFFWKDCAPAEGEGGRDDGFQKQ
jgi:hypothetical protein